MFRHNVIIAFRNLSKHKGYALTNILGLAVGLVVTFMIVLFIQFQLSYDSFHRNADRLYRVAVVYSREGTRIAESPVFLAPMGAAMRDEIPEVENAVRISTPRIAYVSYGENTIKLDEILHADSSFFDLFSFTMVSGDQRHALTRPFSIVLTEPTARRIFGAEDPVGKTVKLDDTGPYLVTGVAQEPPENSHIRFQALISFSTLYHIPDMFMDWNGGEQYISYVLLHRGTSPTAVQAKLPRFMWKHINQQFAAVNVNLSAYLQPFPDIHLYYNHYSGTLRTNLFIFSAVALLILIIASANFVNLANARAIPRAREVGVRKVLGAGRGTLFRQFLGESFLLTAIAVLVALFLVEMLSSETPQLLGFETSIFAIATPITGIVFFGLFVTVGLASGIYPALYLSSMEAIKTLKGGIRTKKGVLRDGLVVLQFAISIGLIICTAIAIQQMKFVKQKDLGFAKDNMVVLSLIGEDAQSKAGLLKSELLRIPEVSAATASSDVPRDGFTSNGYFPEGFTSLMTIHEVDVDDDFFHTFGIELVKGRSFIEGSAMDKEAYLINESLARTLNWNDPLGKTIRRNGTHAVIGVVKDFHFATLHDKIEPLIITNRPWGDRFTFLTLKLRSTNLKSTLARVQSVWEHIAPSAPFTFSFLDQSVDRLYQSEHRLQFLFEWFSAIAIVIAVVGLLSLVSLSIEQRTKEIGVRKVLGASFANIAGLLSNRVVKLVVVASVIAWPLAFVAATRWLDEFAYRTDIEPWVFVATALGSLMIALAAVSYHTIRASLANPVEALRYE
jgi:putative ABC transport system permease protein